MAVIQDVTKAVEQENRIREDQRRLHATFENMRDCAICTVGLDGRIESFNRSLDRAGGGEEADAANLPVDVFFSSGKDGSSIGALLLERASQRGTAEIEGWGVRRNGSTFWGNTVATALPDRDGRASGFVLVIRDLTNQKQIEDRLVALATPDPMTLAYNRRAGDDRLAEAFGRWRRYARAFAVLMIDCDHFKSVNDRWGHDGGDAVLVALVDLCRPCVRETDVTIRWGGEEFLQVLPETSGDVARTVAEGRRGRHGRACRRMHQVYRQHRRRGSERKRTSAPTTSCAVPTVGFTSPGPRAGTRLPSSRRLDSHRSDGCAAAVARDGADQQQPPAGTACASAPNGVDVPQPGNTP